MWVGVVSGPHCCRTQRERESQRERLLFRGGLDLSGTMGCYVMRFFKLNLMLSAGL